jgi:2-dehydro-3-deoxyphosphogluconate aldolase/(4S)-4-hydroxy-2-oxoglutarate aldolase
MPEKRVDPEDGSAYTWEEFSEYYAGKYKKKAIEAYWEELKLVGKKGKAKAETKSKAKAKAAPEPKAKAKAKVKAKAKAKKEFRKVASPDSIMEIVADCKVIPVVGIENVDHTLPLCNALVAGGIKVIEIVYRTDCALEAMKEACKCEGMCVGAGTVLTVKQAADALEIGCDFIVSPGFDDGVAKLCQSRKALYLPGTVTPTEVMLASSKFKLKVLKFFPAGNYGGIGTLKSFGAVFGDIKFMPTGGVSEANVGEFTALPNVVACGGSWLTKDMGKCAESGDWSAITEVSKKARAAAGCS